MSFTYQSMSLTEIVDDLTETLSDLFVNAGEKHLEPLLDTLGTVQVASGQQPSARLVAVMDELLTHDANLLVPRAQELMREAVAEIQRTA